MGATVYNTKCVIETFHFTFIITYFTTYKPGTGNDTILGIEDTRSKLIYSDSIPRFP